ncbi:hypothetical protein [Bradyrhizobium lablabi]|uniref:hypothetical protein n=1 Tax=Bradyrhizobium lablabi TaxID=722472 RepID=UPI0012E378D5|nr:hypothetical protein [Bradyrhizobium lablabi]
MSNIPQNLNLFFVLRRFNQAKALCCLILAVLLAANLEIRVESEVPAHRTDACRLWGKSGGVDLRGPMSGLLLTTDVANA